MLETYHKQNPLMTNTESETNSITRKHLCLLGYYISTKCS